MGPEPCFKIFCFTWQKQCFSNLCALYKTLSGFEHSVCQLQTFYILACVAGGFFGANFVFGSYLYGRARGQKSKRWMQIARGRERVFPTTLLPSPPLPSPPPPFPIIFWFDLGSGFRTGVSLTLRTTKEETPTPKTTRVVVGKVRLDKSLPCG